MHGLNKHREWFLSLKPSERGRYLYPRICDGFRRDVDPHTGLLAGPKYMHYSVMGYPVCREVFLQVYPVSDRVLKDMVSKAKEGRLHFYQRDICGERLRRPVLFRTVVFASPLCCHLAPTRSASRPVPHGAPRSPPLHRLRRWCEDCNAASVCASVNILLTRCTYSTQRM